MLILAALIVGLISFLTHFFSDSLIFYA